MDTLYTITNYIITRLSPPEICPLDALELTNLIVTVLHVYLKGMQPYF